MKVKKLQSQATLPTRNHSSDAGLDLYAIHPATLDLEVVTKIGTGIAIELPENSVGLILDRSSLGSKGITVLGGVIDSSYRGEIIVILTRLATPDYDSITRYKINDWDITATLAHNNTTEYKINAGDKIAQLVVVPILLPDVEEVEELTDTSRGDNGFGSTGI